MRAAPRIARTVLKAKRDKNPRRQPEHLTFIRKLPCLGCGGCGPCEAAHVRMGTDGSMGKKPSDKFTVPLHPTCHRLGTDSQHNIPEHEFWALRGIDPVQVAERLWTISGNVEQGERAIFRARQTVRA